MTSSNSPIEILMCGNEQIRNGLLLTVLSIIERTDRPLKIHLATMDLTDVDPAFSPISENTAALVDRLVKEKNPESAAKIDDLGAFYRAELMGGKNEGTRYTPYTLLRLFVDRIPNIGEKVLYLDCDVMLLSDVGELFDLDISRYHLAGVRDRYGRFFRAGVSVPYYNAGVLLMNLDMLRADSVLARSIAMCRERKMLLPDQDALNRTAKKKLTLPRRFNEQNTIKEDTLIRHFSMKIRFFPYVRTKSVKPWQLDLVCDEPGIHKLDGVFARYQTLKEVSE